MTGGSAVAGIANHAADPGITPNTRFVTLPSEHRLLAAITAPSESSPYAQAESLPVLLKPYGGPGAQQVLFSQSYYWESQWWADQGFLVVTVDGRGHPRPRTPVGPRHLRDHEGRDPGRSGRGRACVACAMVGRHRRAVGALDAAGGRQAGRLRFRRHRSAARHRAPERPARLPQARPGQGRDDRLVVRRLPVRARRARRARRRPRPPAPGAPPDRLDALRHPLHRALPGPGPGGLPPQRHCGGRAQAAPSAHAHPRLRRRQRHHRPRRCG